jgi:hypothetical protein
VGFGSAGAFEGSGVSLPHPAKRASTITSASKIVKNLFIFLPLSILVIFS